jgi:thiol:disulfide interchange protein DsbD
MMDKKRRLVILSGLVLTSITDGVRAQADLLQPSEAFQIRSVVPSGRWLEIEFRAAPGYYLYADRFAFEPDNKAIRVVAVALPPGHQEYDETLGKKVTYLRGTVRVRLRLEGPANSFKLTARAQGCADVGVCYPPVVKTFQLPGTTL